MCEPDPKQLQTLAHHATASASTLGSTPDAQGSRRRRLWELDSHAHCPVIGVCLPISTLRKLVNKVLGGQAVADDYELHCGAVAECKQRSAVAEALQRELDQRYALPLQQAAKAKTTEALAAWWQASLQNHALAGALWATLSHARCTPALAHRVEGQVHMLQHQVGMLARLDITRFDALHDENAVLGRELAAAQQRCSRQTDEYTRRHELQQSQVVQLRAQLIGRDTTIATLQEDLHNLEAAAPGLKRRHELAREAERLIERNHALQRSLLQAQQDAERLQHRVDELGAELQGRLNSVAEPGPPAATGREDAARLRDQAVLCVGGRPSSVPIYRQLIEGTGGRFLHHDGGEEENPARLEAMVAAADLVICQTGCISHNAYWRVKDHCKRSGKRCVFVESPSGAGLKRALLLLMPAMSDDAKP